MSLYKSPSQSQDNFENFTENLELNLENLMQRNPFLVVQLEVLVLNQATGFVHSSLDCTKWLKNQHTYSNCHYQIIFAKFNLDVIYPPPYVREVRHYKDANTELIKRAINELNWQRAFLNTNVNDKKWTFLNILSNFIPHEFLVRDDKDSPWFNKKIRALIQEKKMLHFKNYRNSATNIDLKCRLKYLQACLNASVEVAKEKYHNTVNKLINTQKILKYIGLY